MDFTHNCMETMRKLTAGAYLQRVVAGVVCLVAILVAIFDAVGDVPHWISLPSLTTAVLGLLVLLLLLDHEQTARRIEKIEDLNLHSRLLGLSEKAFRKIDLALTDYVSIYAHWKFQKRHAPHAADFLSAYTDEHLSALRTLRHGRLEVPHRLQSHVQHMILQHMHTRFDAVSDQDLDYWLQNESSDYHEAIRSSRRRSGTIVNRIFIFSTAELRERTQEIARVLRVQQKSGFGWGVAVWDEIDIHQRNANNVFDFAFSGNDGVLTYFRKEPNKPRKLEVVLPTKENQAEMQRQRDVFAHMIGECWLVNLQFATSCSTNLTPEQLGIAQKVATTGNEHVIQMLKLRTDLHSHPLLMGSSLIGRAGQDAQVEGAPDFFLLKTADLEMIEHDLQKLDLIVDNL
jgi:hypothetical protein